MALAALADWLIGTDQAFQCQAELVVDGQTFKNWDEFVNEPMTLRFVGELAGPVLRRAREDLRRAEAEPLAGVGAQMGFGKRSGIDVGPENAGLVPTPAWRRRE